MKRTKDELKNRVNEIVTDIDVATELLEDIEDSMDIPQEDSEEVVALRTETEHLKQDLEDLKLKYKNRFLGVVEEDNDIPTDVIDDEEKTVVDIKEI